MDSDEEMHDCYSDEDVGFGSDDKDLVDDDDDYVYGDEESDDSDDRPSHRQQNYTVLSEVDIEKSQEEDVARLSNVLSISRVDSCVLLCHYNWNVSKVHDEWFADEGNVRKSVGLLEQPVIILDARELTCRICFENYPRHEMSSVACGHQFCHGCWRGYIGTSVNDGPGCLTLRCPDPSCNAAVGPDMISNFVSDEDKEKYSRYFLRSYIESKRKTKWCPAPGCEFAVKLDMSNSNYDVCCRCTCSFCWNCMEDAHRPVVCETVAKWTLKNSAESENMNWILANSKACPKCKRPIEKNHGCMHMTCSAPCRFEFCWLCLGAWSNHGERTGGFYACNRYEAAKQEGLLDEDEKRRERAKNSLERYTHYYERWATNQLSRKKALAELQNIKIGKLEKLSIKLCLPETELKFLVEAWEQIVECRRVLKWTYAYGYYLPDTEDAKRQLFEYLQGEAESGLERLHACAEKELQSYFDAENPSGDSQEFVAFRTKLVDLTRITRNYFENLVHAFETGLKEVNSADNDQQAASSSESENHSSSGGRSKVATISSVSISMTVTEADYEDWRCSHCTFVNPKTTDTCGACENHI
ncbi:uncharacterized protein A4U43_C04F19720 [Asparagus officinalis]|uniref:RBR-type E3 ubiquitin transferase n=1 Tax=Asparagus officinalis TaxID=4686 RepID=A0A5P1F295_ASPOF|nr:probable E3 ubiquitin-protein ligase ARI8 [Asparagus officinalis]ONK72465.1 uncharacterized protein A4U43_C04F19720 [Asparagus officinalis]